MIGLVDAAIDAMIGQTCEWHVHWEDLYHVTPFANGARRLFIGHWLGLGFGLIQGLQHPSALCTDAQAVSPEVTMLKKKFDYPAHCSSNMSAEKRSWCAYTVCFTQRDSRFVFWVLTTGHISLFCWWLIWDLKSAKTLTLMKEVLEDSLNLWLVVDWSAADVFCI